MVTRAVGLFKTADEKGPDDHVVWPPRGPGWNELRDVMGRDRPLLLGLQGSRPDPRIPKSGAETIRRLQSRRSVMLGSDSGRGDAFGGPAGNAEQLRGTGEANGRNSRSRIAL